MKELDHIDADDALGYAQRLATALWEKYGKERAPNWKPLDTVLGVLTQIDNMTAGMVRKDEQPAEAVGKDWSLGWRDPRLMSDAELAQDWVKSKRSE